MPYLKSFDGTELYFEECGAGKPVVFIHGWPLSSRMWEYQMVALSQQGIRCIAYDRRGFGRSDHAPGGYDYDTFADDLKSVLETLNLKDVTLAGFSMGGGEVARYMSRHNGARVAKVALISSVTPFMLKTADNVGGVDETIFEKMMDGLKADRPAFLTEFANSFFNVGIMASPVSMPMLAATCEDAMRASAIGTLACVRAFSETDFRADLAAIKVPALIVHGDDDKTVPIEVSGNETARLLPHARFEVYAGAPHGLYFTDKDRLNADLAALVLGTGAGNVADGPAGERVLRLV